VATPTDDSSKLEEKLVKAEKRVEDLKEKIGTGDKKFGEKIRMEVIEKMFDDFDTIFIKYSKNHEVNFMELETCLLMLKKKIEYEQLRTWAPTLFSEPERKKSLFDSITMFGKTLPEIFHNAGMSDEEIEMFRSRFNDDTKDMSEQSRIETLEQYIPTEEGMEELEKYDKISRLKESMKKGYTPPEDQ